MHSLLSIYYFSDSVLVQILLFMTSRTILGHFLFGPAHMLMTAQALLVISTQRVGVSRSGSFRVV